MKIILPTRGRPQRLAYALECAVTARTKTPILIRVDMDDPCLKEYMALKLPSFARLNVAPRNKAVGGAMNELLATYPDENCYGCISDDSAIRTEYWDQALEEAASNWYVAYPDDLLAREKLPTHQFVGGDMVRAIGWFALPGTVRLYMDTAWRFIGIEYGMLRYCPHVVIEHMKPTVGKAKMDQTYVKPEAANDKMLYDRFVRNFVRDPAIVAAVSGLLKTHNGIHIGGRHI